MSGREAEGDEGWVTLAGGPSGISHLYQHPGGGVAELDKITVSHYGRNEHFERTGEIELVDERQLPVFRWTYSTKIAE